MARTLKTFHSTSLLALTLSIALFFEQVPKRELTLNPQLANAYLLKGNLLLRVSRSADALTAFGEYLRLDPNGPFANETRALVEKIKKSTAHAN